MRQEWGHVSGHELDRRWVVELGERQCFRQVDDDGANPGGTTAIDKTSLVDFVAARPGMSHTKAVFEHPWWSQLRDRTHAPSVLDERIDAILDRVGLARVTAEDRHSGAFLCWPELFPVSEAYTTLVVSMPKGWPSLDVLSVLLRLYRHCSDNGDHKTAVPLKFLLEEGAHFLSMGLSGEAKDTWNFLVETRALRWAPDFAPSEAQIELAFQELMSQPARGAQKRRGRPRLKPGQSQKGKVERRWRRKAWMFAACDALRQDDFNTMISTFYLRPANDYTRYLRSCRERSQESLEMAPDREPVPAEEFERLRALMGWDPPRLFRPRIA